MPHDDWLDLSDCLEVIGKKYRFAPYGASFIHHSHLVSSKENSRIIYHWGVSSLTGSFKMSLVNYQFRYPRVHYTGGSTEMDESFYLFGSCKCSIDLGHTLIRPEKIGDKIKDFFEPVDIDFEQHKFFSFKFVVESKNPELCRKNFPAFLPDILLRYPKALVEFRNGSCVFRLPKSLDPEETLELCKLGLALSKVL